MSLIPSESYSFPDHFTNTIVPSRRLKNAETGAEERPTQPKKSAIVALPDPESAIPQQKLEPAKAAESLPNPAPLRAQARPPRIPELPSVAVSPVLKPKTQIRTPALDPAPPSQNRQNPTQFPTSPPAAQNVIPMQPVPAPTASPQLPTGAVEYRSPAAGPISPRASVWPQPARAVPRAFVVQHLQPEFFEILAENSNAAAWRQQKRRKTKFRRFIVCESAALAVLLPLAILGLLHRPENVVLVWIRNISTIASAVTVALIPILFYAFTPTLPEIEE